MHSEETRRDVPSDKVGEVVQGFVDSGAQDIQAVRNGEDSWDVTARLG